MKKQIVAYVLFFIFLAQPLWADSEDPGLKAGALLPLSGEFHFVGRALQQGMELALKDYQSEQIEICYEDDQTFRDLTAVTAVKKLVNVDNVDVVLNSVVNTSSAIAPILNKKKVPGVVIWDNNKRIQQLGDWIFAQGVSTELAGEDMAEHAFKNLAVKNVSVISVHDEWSEIISSAFIDKFQRLGGTVDLHEKFLVEENDFRSLVSRIKKKKSEAIYFPLFPHSLQALVKQLRAFDYDGYLLTGDSFAYDSLKVLGDLAEGLFATQVWHQESSLSSKYKEQYGDQENSINMAFVALGYDAVKMLAELSRKLKASNIPVNSQSIKDNLPGFEFTGMTGQTSFDAAGVTSKRQALLHVRDGELVRVPFVTGR